MSTRAASALAILALVAGCAGSPSADTIIVNARVFTSDEARPWAEAVGVRGDRIVAVGARAEVEAVAGPGTRRIDAGGRTLIPGLNDAHVHVPIEPDAVGLPLSFDPDLAQIDTAVVSAHGAAAADRMLRGNIGPSAWDDARLTRAWLDARAPNRPVWLSMFHGHGLVLNSAALALIGLDDAVSDPDGGRYGRDTDGRLNGRLEEYAGYVANARLAAMVDPIKAASRFAAFSREALGFGITSVHLMADALPVRTTAQRVLDAGTPIRWRILRFPTRQAGEETRDSRPHLPPQPSLTMDVRGMKWVLDGTPIERLAFVSAPYADAPGERGRLNFSPERLREFVGWAYGSEDLLAVHATGDAAIEAYVSAVEQAGLATVWQRKRPRLEHGDMLTPALRKRIAGLGMVVVQNPSHLTFRDVFLARYGAARVAQMQPLRSLVAEGIPLAFGSDGVLNPFLNIGWASTHPANPAEALTREQAVVAYTRGSAYAEFADRDKGHLIPGALADLAVLSDDIFTAPAERLESIRSVLTMIGGRIVHDTGTSGGAGGS